jgi:DMSO/TMAO reductase YedYZ molybdopterin-dependent catalytic subunit
MSKLIMPKPFLSRRALLRAGIASAAALPLGGCNIFDGLRERDSAMREFMQSINYLTYKAQRLLQSENQLAPEFSQDDIRQDQHPNGSTEPDTEEYLALQEKNFVDYQLQVDGLVERPMQFTLDAIRALPSRTQITRHDCVEGWSCIAKWQGVPLKNILDAVGVKQEARYVLFHCFDAIEKTLSGEVLYYETIDLLDARHPQTILAYAMNDKPLPVENGAPLRVRVERQLGYKMAKYLRRIELISDFAAIGEGHGSYWADRGYEWYAGI